MERLGETAEIGLRNFGGFGFVKAQFNNVKFCPEVARVGEGLELPERGGIRISFKRKQPLAGEMGEPTALRLKGVEIAAQCVSCFCESRKINMGSDVNLARRFQRIFGSTVF